MEQKEECVCVYVRVDVVSVSVEGAKRGGDGTQTKAAAESACFADLLEMLIGSVALEPPQKLRLSAALE